MEASPRPIGARFDRNGSAAPELRSTAVGEPTAGRLAKQVQPGPAGEELGPVELPPRRRPSAPMLAAAAAVTGCAALAFGAWGVVRVVTSDSSGAAATGMALTPVEQVTALLARPTTLRLPLRHSGGHIVLAVGSDGEGALVFDGLAAAPAGKIYRAWVVERGSKNAISAAEFSGAELAVPLATVVPPGATVGVSVERAGDTSAPTRALTIVTVRPEQ